MTRYSLAQKSSTHSLLLQNKLEALSFLRIPFIFFLYDYPGTKNEAVCAMPCLLQLNVPQPPGSTVCSVHVADVTGWVGQGVLPP